MDIDEEKNKEQDFICPVCGIRQYSNVCPNCNIVIEEEEEKEKTKDDDDEYDYRERR